MMESCPKYINTLFCKEIASNVTNKNFEQIKSNFHYLTRFLFSSVNNKNPQAFSLKALVANGIIQELNC